MELVIKDMPVRKGMICVMETSREMVQAGRIPITRIRIWRCIYRRMESRSGNSEDSVWWDSYWNIWNCYNGSWGIGAGFSSSVMLGISAVLAAFTVGGGILLGQGCSSLTSLSRRNKYIKALGTHTYCNFQQLAQAVGKPVKFVKKDIKRMISKGWFLQGHVDKQETCLIHK